MNPNMDEVVRQVKEALGNATAGPWADNVFEPYTTVYSYDHLTEEPDGIIAKCEHEPDAHLISNAPDWLRLLIEEREQLKAENERLYLHEKNRINDYYETTAKYKRDKIALESKVAEQDKEIQRYKLALEQMDDRKNGMLPRSEMARIAKETLDQ